MSNSTVLPNTQPPPQDSRAPEIPFEFEKEKDVFKALETDFGPELEATKIRRELRANRKNVAELRQQGILLPDETVIPDRTIEQNCQSEIIPYIAFTEQPNQVLSFHDPANPGFDYTLYADWITSLLRYENWQLPWQQMEDAMVLHGAGFHEVIFDPESSAKFTIEYVRRDHFLIPKGTKDLNACYRFARQYEITKHQLDVMAAAYGFDEKIVKDIKEHYKTKSEFINVYKYFLRDENNYLYNAWLAPECVSATAWLRPPTPHFLGDYDIDELGNPISVPTTVTPFTAFPYRTQEDEAILTVQGQAALSVHVQEALTGLYSATVNGAVRASGVYAARPVGPGKEPDNKTLYTLKSGYVHDGDMTFFSLAWPNPIALSLAQALSVRNSAQQGNTDFAAMSRTDTAKRATEIIAAKEEADKIKTARIALFSSRCLAEYRIVFNIILNQIKIGAITLPPPLDPAVLFSPALVLSMAADTQVVKREQRKQKLVDIWPLVQTTPLAPVYFESMIAELFPEEWPIWKAAMNQLQTQQANDPTQTLVQLLTAAFPTMPPELQNQTEQALNAISPGNPEGGAVQNVA